jgi:hypothetical protein
LLRHVGICGVRRSSRVEALLGWLAEIRRIRRVPHRCGALVRYPCGGGISAARGELSLARSAAAPGRAQPVRTSAGTRRAGRTNSGWTLCHSASLRGRCSPRRLPKVAHASAKHTYSGRKTSRTNHQFWRIVNGWSSRRRVGATGTRGREGAAQQRVRAAGSDVAPRCRARRGRDGRAETCVAGMASCSPNSGTRAQHCPGSGAQNQKVVRPATQADPAPT